jgi:hypothetical protein
MANILTFLKIFMILGKILGCLKGFGLGFIKRGKGVSKLFGTPWTLF